MLNAHPDVASVGELKQLGRFARLEKPNRQLHCTCGAESLLSCEFWTRVSAHTKAATGRTVGELNVEDYDEVESFDRDNAALFEAIAAVSGKRYIVDSSKHVARLSLLIKNPALDVFPVFLLRDPKGQILLVEKIIGQLDEAHRKLRAHQSRNPRAGEGSPAFGGALRGARAQSRAGARLADASAWPLLRSAAARMGIADTS